MSELKTTTPKALVITGRHNEPIYLKSEVDEVIAEKDKEIARLDDLAHDHNLELLQKENCIAELKDKLRHYPMMVALLENDKKEIEERNAIHQKSLARLHELARKTYPDQEEDHCEADGILCDMLNALGYKDLTDAWDKIGKWYS